MKTIPNSLGLRPIDYAAFHGQVEIVSFLIDEGVNPNQLNEVGYGPLHYAVMGKQHTIIQKLLNWDIKVNVKAKGCMTPLHLAVYFDQEEIVRTLLANNAEPRIIISKKPPINAFTLCLEKKLLNIFDLLIASDGKSLGLEESKSGASFLLRRIIECNGLDFWRSASSSQKIKFKSQKQMEQFLDIKGISKEMSNYLKNAWETSKLN